MRPRQESEVSGKGDEDADRVIEVSDLHKSYGKIRALDGVSFAVGKGEVFAYLGPNGAGKTTTINILSGLVQADGGRVSVYGLDITRQPVAVKQRIGVVPEDSNLYPELTCARNLSYIGELYGLPRKVRARRVVDLLERFGLAERSYATFGSLSRGMKRRLTVAAALVHSPEVLFLDEPTSGLDVPGARALRSLIRTVNRDGTTVFLTTHNLAEAESLSDHIVILVRGRTVAEGTAEEIRQKVGKAGYLLVSLSGDVREGSLREACPAVKSAAAADGKWRLEVGDTHSAIAQVLSFAEKEGVRVVEIATAAPSLEEAFVTIVEGSGGVTGGKE